MLIGDLILEIERKGAPESMSSMGFYCDSCVAR